MYMRKSVMLVAAALVVSPAVAQDEGGQDVPRTSADLPERLEGTNERAPEPPPESSAAQIGTVDPETASFGIGRPATEAEIAAINIDVMPDGTGLPEGSGTYAEGEELYATYCMSCHAEDLGGVPDLGAARLIGGRGTLASDSPVKTVESYWPYASTLFDYMHRAMPMNAPGSLSHDEVYAISAYILGRADIIEEDVELDRDTFSAIKMPNADGFVDDPRPDVE